MTQGWCQGFSTLPKFCRKNFYCPSLTSAVQSGTSRAHAERSFISPFPLLPFHSLPACVHGDLPVCFAFLAILFQLSDNLFSPPLDLHVGMTYSWDNAVILAAASGATFCCFLDHQLRLMESRSLNSIITDRFPLLFTLPTLQNTWA